MNNETLSNLDVFASNHEPYWISSASTIDYPKLEEDINVDVAIIGGNSTVTETFIRFIKL